jgi:hypothetical protein
MYNDTHIALGLVNIHMSIVALKWKLMVLKFSYMWSFPCIQIFAICFLIVIGTLADNNVDAMIWPSLEITHAQPYWRDTLAWLFPYKTSCPLLIILKGLTIMTSNQSLVLVFSCYWHLIILCISLRDLGSLLFCIYSHIYLLLQPNLHFAQWYCSYLPLPPLHPVLIKVIPNLLCTLLLHLHIKICLSVTQTFKINGFNSICTLCLILISGITRNYSLYAKYSNVVGVADYADISLTIIWKWGKLIWLTLLLFGTFRIWSW